MFCHKQQSTKNQIPYLILFIRHSRDFIDEELNVLIEIEERHLYEIGYKRDYLDIDDRITSLPTRLLPRDLLLQLDLQDCLGNHRET